MVPFPPPSNQAKCISLKGQKDRDTNFQHFKILNSNSENEFRNIKIYLYLQSCKFFRLYFHEKTLSPLSPTLTHPPSPSICLYLPLFLSPSLSLNRSSFPPPHPPAPMIPFPDVKVVNGILPHLLAHSHTPHLGPLVREKLHKIFHACLLQEMFKDPYLNLNSFVSLFSFTYLFIYFTLNLHRCIRLA